MLKKILLSILIVFLLLVVYLMIREQNKPDKSVQPDSASVEGSPLLTETYNDSELGFSIKIPKGYKVVAEGKNSKRILPDVIVGGMGPTNYLYISRVTTDMKENVGEIYNYNPSHYKKMAALESPGEQIDLSAEDRNGMGEWFTYQLVAIEDLDQGTAKNFQNSKPWEFPGGTTENRFIYETKNNIYLLGYYTGGDGLPVEASIDPRLAYAIIKSFRITDL